MQSHATTGLSTATALKAIEAGIMFDFYFKKVPIMVENDVIDAENRPFFINLFINLQLGKRW